LAAINIDAARRRTNPAVGLYGKRKLAFAAQGG